MSTPMVRELTPALLRRYKLRKPAPDGDKNAHGRALVAAGSLATPGAALLAAEACLRTGVGKIGIALPRAAMVAVGLAVPEARVLPLEGPVTRAIVGAQDAILVGPGMQPDTARRWRRAALASDAAVVLDAAALPGLRRQVRRAPTIVTPHSGEMAALSGRSAREIERDPLAVARDTARELGLIVVLKGPTTVVVAGDALFRNRTEIPGLGSSGSGDVLAGLIAGLAAQGVPGLDACLWGVALHAAAGRRLARSIGTTGYLARELAREVPVLIDRARR